jgi:hypothetical protein
VDVGINKPFKNRIRQHRPNGYPLELHDHLVMELHMERTGYLI